MTASAGKVNSDTSRPCYPRKKFDNKYACQRASSRVALKRGEQRFAEPCSDCNGWHIARLK